MGDNEVLEIDTAARKVVRTITGMPKATGVIVVPTVHRVFVSTPGAGQVATLDADSGQVLARSPAGSFPDGLAWVPGTGQVWVSDESGGIETVLDAASGQRVATVKLGGEAGNVRYDPGSDKVLVDVQSRNRIAVINPRTRVIERQVPVPGCDHDHGLIIAAGRAFVACDGNARLVVLALPQLTPLGNQEVGAEPDVLAVDPARKWLYVAAESGVLTVLDTGPAPGRVIGRDRVGDNAHVVAVDAHDGSVFLPVRRGAGGRPQLLVMAPS
jgi:DNA-binding beta-propeller fold protein YncE